MQISNFDLFVITKSIAPLAEFDLDKSLFENLRELFLWGTRGKDGNLPLKYVPLKDLESDHIQAILDTQDHISSSVKLLFQIELDSRQCSRAELLADAQENRRHSRGTI